MINMQDDEVEKMMPSAKEKEEEDGEEDDARDGDKDGSDEEQENSDGEGGEEKEEEEEAVPQAEDKHEKNVQLPVQPKGKKQSEGLNLNNEVVMMRKEVKRVRALIIRKLTRQIGALKKKKGNEKEVERNQRRAARLLEEIHAMKGLSPDLVTKTALQKNLNFEQECKNPKSTISDRAIARIATHPQFNKKIETIKAAVKAFKEERVKVGNQTRMEKMQNKAGKMTPQSPDAKGGKKCETKEDITGKENEITGGKEGDYILKGVTDDATITESDQEKEKDTDTAVCQKKEMAESKSVRPASEKSSKVKDIVKNKPQSKDVEKKPSLKSVPEVLQKKKEEEESDLELSDDEEREYFDDSTEERFHKQSSQSEESDDGDDFFVGKVSKFKKKKKKQKSTDEEKGQELKVDSTNQVQSELDKLESRLKSKATPLMSVFCSLSASKPGGGRGAGRGRGGDKFRGQGNPRGGSSLKGDFSQQTKFKNQEKGPERSSGSKYNKSESSERGFSSVGRGRGRGRGNVMMHKDRRGGGVFSHQAPQQALHPSWEASKKRKEQQGQIMAFQGKKIKFDNDD